MAGRITTWTHGPSGLVLRGRIPTCSVCLQHWLYIVKRPQRAAFLDIGDDPKRRSPIGSSGDFRLIGGDNGAFEVGYRGC